MGCGKSIQESAAKQPSIVMVSSNYTSSSTEEEEEQFNKDWRVVCDKLGEGSYAEVYAVHHNRLNQRAAIKIPKSSEANNNAKREAIIWKKMGRHDNVLKFISDLTIHGRHVILMEQCKYTLRERFPDMSSISVTTTGQIFHQMTSSIAHLESLRIVHRDVKPDNFLCTGGDPILKLCDFGFAKEMPSSNAVFGTYGTPYFMSPEMVGDGPHDLKTDAWSLGASFYLMLYGEAPYGGREKSGKTVMKAIATGSPGPQYQGRGHVSDSAKDIIVALLERDTVHRRSASQALDMSFLSSASKQFPAKLLAEGVESQSTGVESLSTADIWSKTDVWSSSCESLMSEPPSSKGILSL